MNLNESIGNRISQLRKQNHMTQEQLAEKLDISTKHCSCVERGTASLSLERMIDVCNLFDVSLDYLVRGLENNSSDSFPPSIINIVEKGNPNQVKLLNEYLRLFTKLMEEKPK